MSPDIVIQAQIAKFNQTILEMIDEFRRDLLKEAKKGYIKEESKRHLSQFTAIINTAGDEVGNSLLIRAANELEECVTPDFPFDFPTPIRINKAFKLYKKALRIAMGRDQQGWMKIMQAAARNSFHSRMEDKMNDIGKLMQKMQYQLQEKQRDSEPNLLDKS